jgi:hypothetical protein
MNVRVASLSRSQRRLVRLTDNDLHLIFADSLGSIWLGCLWCLCGEVYDGRQPQLYEVTNCHCQTFSSILLSCLILVL